MPRADAGCIVQASCIFIHINILSNLGHERSFKIMNDIVNRVQKFQFLSSFTDLDSHFRDLSIFCQCQKGARRTQVQNGLTQFEHYKQTIRGDKDLRHKGKDIQLLENLSGGGFLLDKNWQRGLRIKF